MLIFDQEITCTLQYDLLSSQIEEVALVMDKATRTRRGFVFVTFTSFDPVDVITEQSFRQIGSTEVGG
jgi:hypothetical protein